MGSKPFDSLTAGLPLLRAWRPGESIADFRDRVLREDLLGRMTTYRASDIVKRVFAWRYLRPDAGPALALKLLLERGQSGQLFSDLCLLYAARNDKLLRIALYGRSCLSHCSPS